MNYGPYILIILFNNYTLIRRLGDRWGQKNQLDDLQVGTDGREYLSVPTCVRCLRAILYT